MATGNINNFGVSRDADDSNPEITGLGDECDVCFVNYINDGLNNALVYASDISEVFPELESLMSEINKIQSSFTAYEIKSNSSSNIRFSDYNDDEREEFRNHIQNQQKYSRYTEVIIEKLKSLKNKIGERFVSGDDARTKLEIMNSISRAIQLLVNFKEEYITTIEQQQIDKIAKGRRALLQANLPEKTNKNSFKDALIF